MTEPKYCCHKCHTVAVTNSPVTSLCINSPMIVCKTCGNKRCPKATDHNLDCTGSNEPGQQGSIFERWKP